MWGVEPAEKGGNASSPMVILGLTRPCVKEKAPADPNRFEFLVKRIGTCNSTQRVCLKAVSGGKAQYRITRSQNLDGNNK